VAMGGSTTIGCRCFVGSGTMFRAGVRIGDHILVGGGAVVVKNFLEEGLVLVGSPARPLVKKGS